MVAAAKPKRTNAKRAAAKTKKSASVIETPTDLASKKKHVRELALSGRWQEVCVETTTVVARVHAWTCLYIFANARC